MYELNGFIIDQRVSVDNQNLCRQAERSLYKELKAAIFFRANRSVGIFIVELMGVFTDQRASIYPFRESLKTNPRSLFKESLVYIDEVNVIFLNELKRVFINEVGGSKCLVRGLY